ncbi:avidin-like [Heterodontus francisci]|uniref:avidin-like n=1 Tax=Heterodontus francisci TaxID=7792 RepID=UPI00355B6809
MQGKIVYLALTLSLCVFSTSCEEMALPLTGCWISELGSSLNIVVRDSGLISGSYMLKTGRSARGVVTGYQQNLSQPTFGFIVRWITDPGCVTAWTGQHFKIKNREVLKTMWLHRRSASNPEDNWGATGTGSDMFHRSRSGCGVTNGDLELEEASQGTLTE